MKKARAIFVTVTCMILFVSIVLLYSCAWAKHHKSSDIYESDEAIFTNSEDIDATYADWMAKNNDIIKDLPINRIPLLGSHDAGSYGVNRHSHPCHGYLTHSGHHISRMPKWSDVTSARCQSASIEDQLRYGVRYLDLRIAFQNNKYWIEHMWLSTPLLGEDGVFAEIKDFLSKYPQEIVILNMKELWSETGEMTSQEAEVYFQLVEKEFGALLAPAGDFAQATIGSLLAQGAQLIIIGNTERTASSFIWPVNKLDDRWMDTGNSDKLCDELNSRVVSAWRSGESADKLRILQAMTTTKHKILKARETNVKIMERLKTDWKDAPLNVIQVDDSVNSGLMQVIIERLKN